MLTDIGTNRLSRKERKELCSLCQILSAPESPARGRRQPALAMTTPASGETRAVPSRCPRWLWVSSARRLADAPFHLLTRALSGPFL